MKADASALTSAQTAASMPAATYSFGGSSYTHRTGALTAASALPRCSYGYTVSATDNAGNVGTSSGTAMVHRDLASEYNIRIDGPSGGGMYSKSIAPAGDVNGDGVDDVILGREFDDFLSRTNNGVAYVIFGRTAMTTIDLTGTTWADNSHGYRIVGAVSSDGAGASVAGVGDVNGDGKADLAVDAPGSDYGTRTDAGSAYVVWGKATNTVIDLNDLNNQAGGGYRIVGSSRATSGGPVSPARGTSSATQSRTC